MTRLTVLLLALAFAAPAAAELFRWVDEKGGVHYSDQPPPASTKQVKRVGRGGSPAAPAEAGRTGAAVVLYSANCGATCDKAADYLRRRGVPFTLKNIQQSQEHAAELKKRTGATQVPVLVIGDAIQRGYSEPVWDTMLSNAGYSTKPQAAAGEAPEGK